MNILVAGLPKTGTTALLYLVENSLKDAEISFEPKKMAAPSNSSRPFLSKVVYPCHENSTLTDFLNGFSNFDKRIWIVRDPRDQIISAFLYIWYKAHRVPNHLYDKALQLVLRKEAGEKIPFNLIIRAVFGKSGFYHDPKYYLERVNPFFRDSVNGFYLFMYTDLVDKKYQNLSEFLSLDLTSQYQISEEFKRVSRTKSYGNWRAWFEEEDIDYFRPLFSEYMDFFGIPNEWELSSNRIDPEFNSTYMKKLHAGEI